MSDLDFDFVGIAACRVPKVNNCPQVATNVPGVVAVRDTEHPDIIVTMSADSWMALAAAIKNGEFDLST